jgi:DNA-binding transcriptional LysR family regulator
VSLRTFANADWISTHASHGFQAITEMVGRAAGFEPKVTCRADDYRIIQDLVAAGIGVALIPRFAVTTRTAVPVLPIARPARLARTIHVTTRTTDTSSAVKEMTRQLIRRRPSAAP